jgi:hypothetical protein
MATALVGIGLHFVIATGVVLTYYLASRRLPPLTDHPWRLGACYGVAVFTVMNFVVIPLSALSFRPRGIQTMIPGILIHIFGVGIPAALAARAALSPQPQGTTRDGSSRRGAAQA